MSSIVNKVKDAIHTHQEKKEATHDGPHSSATANQVDPRVDSDRDGSRTVGSTGNTSSLGSGNQHGLTGRVDDRAGTSSSEYQSGRDGFGNTTEGGLAGQRAGETASYGSTTGGMSGRDYDSSNIGRGTNADPYNSSTTPHSSNLANKLDPRVDTTGNTGEAGFQRAGEFETGNAGRREYGQSGGFGTTGETHGHHGHHGHHGQEGIGTESRLNESGMGGDNTYSTESGMGRSEFGNQRTAAGGFESTVGNVGNPESRHTAGPHSSDMANKLDPRVDADMDGSRTYGGDKTRQDGRSNEY